MGAGSGFTPVHGCSRPLRRVQSVSVGAQDDLWKQATGEKDNLYSQIHFSEIQSKNSVSLTSPDCLGISSIHHRTHRSFPLLSLKVTIFFSTPLVALCVCFCCCISLIALALHPVTLFYPSLDSPGATPH